jgi:biotin carboxyl carrier protein
MPTLVLHGARYQLSEPKGQGPSWTIDIGEKKVVLRILREISFDPNSLLVQSGTRVLRVSARRLDDPNSYAVKINDTPLAVELESEVSWSPTSYTRASEGPVTIRAPMAGKIVGVKASVGAVIEEGDALVMLEAMKMENVISAPKRGKVKEVYVQTGALAKPGEKLVLIE